MTRPAPRPHLPLALLGAAGGLAFHILTEALRQGWLPERVTLGLAALALVFFTATLGMAGPLALRRAMALAMPLAVGVAGLLVLASLRFASTEAMFRGPIPVLAPMVLTLLPLPFLIAGARGQWRDYPTLFAEAWGSVIRQAAGWLFVGVALLVLILSQALFQMVKIDWLEDLTRIAFFYPLFIGTFLGLGIAVTHDLPGLVAPDLIIRLLRLLLPVLLVVLLVFLVAVPLRGLEALFQQVSAAIVLISLVFMGSTLVTAAVERSDVEATASPLVGVAARILAAVLVLPAGLGIWAVWLRVAQYGWTPDRVVVMCLAGVGLGYGLLYLVASLRGTAWRAAQRQANLVMALLMIALAALLLTPLLSAERLAASSQIARLDDGKVSAEDLDLKSLSEWGTAGAEAIAMLRLRKDDAAVQAALIAFEGAANPAQAAAREAALAALVPLQPAGATALRAAILSDMPDWERDRLRTACAMGEDGLPGCAMVVADLVDDLPGAEAVLVLRDAGSRLEVKGYSVVAGRVRRLESHQFGATGFTAAEAGQVLRGLQMAEPQPVPAPLQMLSVGRLKLLLLPVSEGNR